MLVCKSIHHNVVSFLIHVSGSALDFMCHKALMKLPSYRENDLNDTGMRHNLLIISGTHSCLYPNSPQELAYTFSSVRMISKAFPAPPRITSVYICELLLIINEHSSIVLMTSVIRNELNLSYVFLSHA